MVSIHKKLVGKPLDPWAELLQGAGVVSIVTATSLTQGQGAAGTSIATASITPAANQLLLLHVVTATSGGGATPSSITGNGLTWTLVDDVALGNVRSTVYSAIGASPSAGAITINYSVAQTNALWQVVQLNNAATSGTVVQHAVGSANNTAVSATLGAGPTPGNAVLGFLAHNSTTADPTPGPDAYVAVTAQQTRSTPSVKQWIEFSQSPQSATVTATNPSAGNYGFVAVEIKHI